jgi:hypothetical protein
MRAQMRQISITGFGAWPFIAAPRHGVLAGLVSCGVIGGADELRRRGHVARLAPAQRRAVHPLGWPPHPAQHGDRGPLTAPRRGIRVIASREHSPALMSHGAREGCPSSLRRWEPIVLSPPRLTIPPVGGTHRAQPLRSDGGKGSQGMPQRVADDLAAIQRPHRRQHRRGGGPLAAPPLQQLARAAPGEQGGTEHICRRPSAQSATTCTEDRGVEAGSCELPAPHLCPVDAAAHGRRRVAIEEPCGAWADCRERQWPGRLSRWPTRGEERPQGVIGAQRPQCIGHSHVAVAFGKRSTGDTGRFRWHGSDGHRAKPGAPPTSRCPKSPRCRGIVPAPVGLCQQSS